MTTKTGSTEQSNGLIPWRKRATYKAAKTRKKRQQQLRDQLSMLYGLLGITVVAGIVVILINWQNAGAARSVSCAQYPEFCVPMAGGATDSAYSAFEAPDARELDQDSEGAPGVVRGMSADNVPFIGDPDAPIHFRTVSNFACSHCNTYHTNDIERFIEEHVLTGEATMSFDIVTTTGGQQYAQTAAQAALCAGEQGAFWEMSDELFRLASAYGVGGFTLGQIEDSAAHMDLDSDELVSCVSSGRYVPLILEHEQFMRDYGVSGTPTLLVRYGDEGEWTRLDHSQRGYDSMVEMTERANAAAE